MDSALTTSAANRPRMTMKTATFDNISITSLSVWSKLIEETRHIDRPSTSALGRFLPVTILSADRLVIGESRHSSKEFICSVRPSLNDRFRLEADGRVIGRRQAAADPFRSLAGWPANDRLAAEPASGLRFRGSCTIANRGIPRRHNKTTKEKSPCTQPLQSASKNSSRLDGSPMRSLRPRRLSPGDVLSTGDSSCSSSSSSRFSAASST